MYRLFSIEVKTMLDITQTEAEGTLTLRYTGELDQHAARQTIERSEDMMVLYPCDSLVLDLSGLTLSILTRCRSM